MEIASSSSSASSRSSTPISSQQNNPRADYSLTSSSYPPSSSVVSSRPQIARPYEFIGLNPDATRNPRSGIRHQTSESARHQHDLARRERAELRSTRRNPTYESTIPSARDVTDRYNLRSTMQRNPTSETIPSAQADPTDRYVYLQREQIAKKLFKTLLKDLIKTGQPPDQQRMEALSSYSDVMTLDKAFEWKYAEGVKGGILWDDDTSSLIFIELPGEIHETISNHVLDRIKGQFPPDTFVTKGSTSELCL